MGRKTENLTGQKFGRLIVLERAIKKGKNAYWLCECNCPEHTKVIVSSSHLTKEHTRSCGCLKKEIVKIASRTHGMSHTRLNRIWRGMRKRCYNSKNKQYKNYGGRGITVCEEWQEFQPFYDWAMANGYKDDLTIERIGTNGNYEPSNCKWATQKEQQNNRRNNHLVKYNGEEKTIAQLANEYGLNYQTLLRRLQKGWTIESALTAPLMANQYSIKKST